MSRKIDTDDVAGVIQEWVAFRTDWQKRSGPPAPGDVKLFLGTMNTQARKLSDLLDINNPEMLNAASEMTAHLAVMAQDPEFFRRQG